MNITTDNIIEVLREQDKSTIQKLLELGILHDNFLLCNGYTHCCNCGYRDYIVEGHCPVSERERLENQLRRELKHK